MDQDSYYCEYRSYIFPQDKSFHDSNATLQVLEVRFLIHIVATSLCHYFKVMLISLLFRIQHYKREGCQDLAHDKCVEESHALGCQIEVRQALVGIK